MSDLEELANQVLSIDNTKDRQDILADLKYTKSVERTINRIFDGEFLNGTERDPSIQEALLILDSDEEDSNNVHPQSTTLPRSPIPIVVQDSSDTEVLASPNRHTVEERETHQDSLSDDFLADITALDDSFSVTALQAPQSPDLSLPADLSPPSVHYSPHSIRLSPDLTPEDLDDLASVSVQNDSDDTASLPSMSDFFDELLTQDRKKGKERADPDMESSQNKSPISLDEEIPTSTIQKKKTMGEKRKREGLEERKRKREEELEERKRKREEGLEEKKRARLRLVEEKKRLKEQKELEKQRASLLEKENRLRTDRVEILKEMILDIHPEFLKTRSGQLVQEILSKKETTIYETRLPNPKQTISWRRKCKSEWNDEQQTFIPLNDTKIIKEQVVLVHVYTQTFVQMIQDDTVDQFIDEAQSANPGCQIMLMLEGLDAYYKKKRLSQRRQFDIQVRSALENENGSETGTSTSRNKRKSNLEEIANGPDQSKVEEKLTCLQLLRNIMLVPTKDEEDTASWIESLTIDLGLGRYKTKNISNYYKVSKCGTDPQDTYYKMLQEIQLCTPAISKSIIYSYPTIQSLHKAYENKTETEGELLLANLNVERSAIHTRDRKINRVMSKKIYTIFNSDDPNQVIY